MEQNFNLSISKSCSENFKQFKQTQRGGFCNSCQKEVVDFTSLSDDELINYLKHNEGNTCGYFKASQLKTYNLSSNQKNQPKHGLLKVAVFTAVSLLSLHYVQAQEPTQQSVIVQSEKQTSKQIEGNHQDLLLKGKVSDETSPLPGVNVVLKGTTIGTSTNFDGEFEFPQALKKGDILVISYLGYETQEIAIKENQAFLNVVLPDDTIVVMGEVEVNEVYEQKQTFWQKLKGIF